ncbi:MAG: CsbD family protein [Thermoplasmatota archaeon]
MADEPNSANRDMIEGNWKQFKGKVREKWGNLTDNDLERLKGKRDQIAGEIQERSGLARREVEREIDRLANETQYRFG